MAAMTIMGVVMIVWCLVTLAVRPETRQLPPITPDLSKKVDAEGKPILDPFGKQVDPLGFIGETSAGRGAAARADHRQLVELARVPSASSSAFGHSILAMSGEETLAQVYREVESPEAQEFQARGARRVPLQHAVDLA